MKKTALFLVLILWIILFPVITQKVNLTEANFNPFKDPYCHITIHSPQHMTHYETGNILLNFTAKTNNEIPPGYNYFYSIDAQDMQSSTKIDVQIISQEYITNDTLQPYTETTLKGQAQLPTLTDGPHSIRVFAGGYLNNGTIYVGQLDIDSFSEIAWFYVGGTSGLPSSISQLTFLSPSNRTYNSEYLTLNVSAVWFFADIKSMSYTIDEILDRHLLILEKPEAESFNHMNGTVIGVNGLPLPGIVEGSHNITLYLEGKIYFPETQDIMQEATVYFAVDVTPPIIAEVSVENKTYNQLDLPLDFIVNEPVSWIGYSLDHGANVTLTGNTTLTLNAGSHSIVFYAEDEAGNMGVSGTIYFEITDPFPTTLVIGSAIAIAAVVGLGLLVYLKKRHR